MRHTIPAAILVLLLLASLSPCIDNPPPAATALDPEPVPGPSGTFEPSVAPATLMSVFTENIGQAGDAAIRYHATSGRIAFADGSFTVRTGSGPLEFRFEGCNAAEPLGLDPASWRTSYFMGNDPASWHTGAANYRALVYENLWDGIDLEFSLSNGSLKYQYLVHEFADPAQIRVRVAGQASMHLAADGSLNIVAGSGETLTDSPPETYYQGSPGDTLESGFVLHGDGTYSFAVEGREASRAIVIDPLVYSTFLGGGGEDSGLALALGADGSAYVAGMTDSAGVLPVSGVQDPRGSHDIFVAKLNPTGETLEYAAFIGGTQYDAAKAMAVDSSGCAHITGLTQSTDFPVTGGAADAAYGGVGDAFVAKLGPDGLSLNYSTYLGGSHDEEGSGIGIDGMGQAYITGHTWSADFPATLRAYGTRLNGDSDAFVTKLSLQGDIILYSTFIGGTGSDSASGIAVLDGYAYITGTTASSDFPVTSGRLNATKPGQNAFAAKLGLHGSALEYSAVLGGSGADMGSGIAVDSLGRAHLTGQTNSTDFPATTGAAQQALGGGTDLFIARLSASGQDAEYCTYLGGSGREAAGGIALDSEGHAHVTGLTESTDFPVTRDGLARANSGNADAFISKVAPDTGRLVYSTYIGGSEDDSGQGIAVADDACVFIAGLTASDDFPATLAVPGKTASGGTDAFAIKADIIAPTADAGPDIAVNESNTVRFDGSGSTDNAGIVNYTWSFFDGAAHQNLSGIVADHFFAVPGNYTVTLTVQDSVGSTDTDTLALSVLIYPIPIADAGPDITVNRSTAVSLDGSASRDNVAITEYSWVFSDGVNTGIMSADASVSWTFSVPGVYRASLTVRDADGNTNTSIATVTVLDNSAPLAVALPVPLSGAGSETALNGSASYDDVGVVNWTWTFVHNGSAVTLYGPEQSYRFWSPGTTQVNLTVSDAAGNSGTDVMAVTVPAPPEQSGIGPVTAACAALLAVSVLLLAATVKGRRKARRDSR